MYDIVNVKSAIFTIFHCRNDSGVFLVASLTPNIYVL